MRSTVKKWNKSSVVDHHSIVSKMLDESSDNNNKQVS